LELEQSRDIARDGKPIRELGDEPSVAILKEVFADEADHYLILGGLIRHHLPITPWTRRWPSRRSTNSGREKKGQPKAADWVGHAESGNLSDLASALTGSVQERTRRAC
jgi:hypothetical protein